VLSISHKKQRNLPVAASLDPLRIVILGTQIRQDIEGGQAGMGGLVQKMFRIFWTEMDSRELNCTKAN
jgi:hypothetical protein